MNKSVKQPMPYPFNATLVFDKTYTDTPEYKQALREVLELIEKMKDQRFSEDTWYYCHAGHLKAKIDALIR